MNEPSTILLRRCKDRYGIRLKREYVQSWREARSQPITNVDVAVEQLKNEVLAKDIRLTCAQSVISENFGQADIETFPPDQFKEGQGVVLQIQDVDDVNNSTFSLLNKLNNLSTVRQVYIERDEDDEVDFPRGLLRWTLSDGVRQIQAMEMEKIDGLDLKTPFGCKVLIKHCNVRRGMLLLKKDDITVLGGDVPELYGGDMIKELETRFKSKLQMTAEPGTPLPSNASARPQPTPSQRPSYSVPQPQPRATQPPSPTQPPPASTSADIYDELAPEDLDQFFDDDFGDMYMENMDAENMDMDVDESGPMYDYQEQYQQQEEVQEQEPENIPQQPFINTMGEVDSDDDFAMTEAIPRPRFTQTQSTSKIALSKKHTNSNNTQQSQVPSSSISVSKKKSHSISSVAAEESPPAPSSPISLSKKKSNSTSPAAAARESSPPKKRLRDTNTTSENDENEDMLKPVKKEKEQDSSIWIDTNMSDSDDEEDDGLIMDLKGRYHITFEKLKNYLTAFAKDETKKMKADRVIIEARCVKVAKFKYGRASGLFGVINICDPAQNGECCSGKKWGVLCDKCIQLILFHKVFFKILEIESEEELEESMKEKSYQKKVLRFVGHKLNGRKIKAVLDLNITEKWKGEDHQVDGPLMLTISEILSLGD